MLKLYFTFFISLFCLASNASSVTVVEIKERSFINLLGGINLIYESKNSAPFQLRVFSYVADGECVGECKNLTSKIYVVTATMDEYPDRRLFSIPSNGNVSKVIIKEIPRDEAENYIFDVFSVADSEVVCLNFRVSLKAIREIKKC